MCTSIACGKKATADQVLLLSRNEDFGQNNWNKYMKYRKEPQYKPLMDSCESSNKFWTLGNGLQVPVPKKSYSYCSIPDAGGASEAACKIDDYFFFEERGINECNVAISATNSMQINEKARDADPPVSVGIEESIIPTLLLPQAETAKEAVQLLGDYVSRFGASEGNGVLIADPNEIWYFEIGSGHYWIAVKVPDDSYLVVANSMRVHDVNLDDKENIIYPNNLFSFVCEEKLLENPDQKNFNFASAFGRQDKTEVKTETDPYYNIDRIWLAQNMLSPSLKPEVRKTEYPLFLKPDHPLELSEIMNVLRATFQGTALEQDATATRPIGMARTAESHIMTLDPEMPGRLKGMIWQAIGSPLGSPFLPFYAVMTAVPESYSCGHSENYSENSAYWAWKSLFALSDRMDQLKELAQYRSQWESFWIAYYKTMRNSLKEMAERNYDTAVFFAETCSLALLSFMAEEVQKKFRMVLTKTVEEQKDAAWKGPCGLPNSFS